MSLEMMERDKYCTIYVYDEEAKTTPCICGNRRFAVYENMDVCCDNCGKIRWRLKELFY